MGMGVEETKWTSELIKKGWILASIVQPREV